MTTMPSNKSLQPTKPVTGLRRRRASRLNDKAFGGAERCTEMGQSEPTTASLQRKPHHGHLFLISHEGVNAMEMTKFQRQHDRLKVGILWATLSLLFSLPSICWAQSSPSPTMVTPIPQQRTEVQVAPSTMSPQVIAGIIGLCGVVFGALVSTIVGERAARRRRKEEVEDADRRRREALEDADRRRQEELDDAAVNRDTARGDTIRQYAYPMGHAVGRLVHRLREVCDGTGGYLLKTAPETAYVTYKRMSTAYRLAAVMGWIQALRKNEATWIQQPTPSRRTASMQQLAPSKRRSRTAAKSSDSGFEKS